jgi:metallophosphoesterase (TIGR00282 family)
MNLLFLGDIAAAPGRAAVAKYVPQLRAKYSLDGVVANGENSAHGRGITAETAREIFAAGVDAITLGDHTFDQKGTEELLANTPTLIRPANYPPGSAGRGFTSFTTAAGKRVGVLNLQGRVFIAQQIDCPFQYSRNFIETHKLGKDYDALVVDIHTEATAEAVSLGHFWDGHASLVVGTHTHIPTADAHVLPKGTAYQTDAGMCGDYNSSLGMSFESVLPNFLSRGRHGFQPATGEGTLCGTLVSTDDATGLATAVKPIRLGPNLPEAQ